MKLTLVPSGEFMMGSKESAEETAAFFNLKFCAWLGHNVLRLLAFGILEFPVSDYNSCWRRRKASICSGLGSVVLLIGMTESPSPN